MTTPPKCYKSLEFFWWLKLKPFKKNLKTFHTNETPYCTSTSRQGLKIHKIRIHTTFNFEEFPVSCDICEKVFENEKTLKKHKKSVNKKNENLCLGFRRRFSFRTKIKT